MERLAAPASQCYGESSGWAGGSAAPSLGGAERLPAVPPSNPRPVTAADLERLLYAAWAGADPREIA